MKISILLIFLIVLGVAVFELNPTVEYARIVVPEDAYVGKACDCQCILSARPWYSKINYWFWSFILIAPILAFSVTPQSSPLLRAARTLIAVLVCYALTRPALGLGLDIRKAPFTVYDTVPFQKTMDMVQCHGNSGIGAKTYISDIGWIYALVYVGWCEIIWRVRYKNRIKNLDFISELAAFIAVFFTALFIISALYIFTGLHTKFSN